MTRNVSIGVWSRVFKCWRYRIVQMESLPSVGTILSWKDGGMRAIVTEVRIGMDSNLAWVEAESPNDPDEWEELGFERSEG